MAQSGAMNRGFAWGAALGLLAGIGGTLLWRSGGQEAEPTDAPRAADAARVPSKPAPRLAGSPSTSPRLKRELEDAKVRIAQLTKELEAARSNTASVPALPRAKEDELPAAAREHAARRRVSDEVLRLVWHARNNCYGLDAATREPIVAPLRAHGEEVVRAVAALNEAGGGHACLPTVVADLRLPNGGDLLIRMIEQDGHAGSLIRALPAYDSPRVRAYLVERIGRETKPGNFWYLAEALGDLKEPKGAEAIQVRQLLGPMWSGVRGYILHAIGRMGGPAALRLLEEYLALPGADAVGAALGALATLDRERARSHAQRIKRSDHYGFLDVVGRSEVDRLAKDDVAPDVSRKITAR